MAPKQNSNRPDAGRSHVISGPFKFSTPLTTPPGATRVRPAKAQQLPSPSPPGPFDATQLYTLPPSTHAYSTCYDSNFGKRVTEAYRLSCSREAFRTKMYGKEVAKQWKRGSTPEEAREAYNKAREEQWWLDYSTSSDEGEYVVFSERILRKAAEKKENEERKRKAQEGDEGKKTKQSHKDSLLFDEAKPEGLC